jgi:hypothetical protein
VDGKERRRREASDAPIRSVTAHRRLRFRRCRSPILDPITAF